MTEGSGDKLTCNAPGLKLLAKIFMQEKVPFIASKANKMSMF